MVGYPYTYKDDLSEEEAMKRRVDFFDKGLVLFVFWSLMSAVSQASDIPKLSDTPSPTPDNRVFAPIAGICACTSPKVKTAILLVGVGSICYCALCSKDKSLVVACSAIAAYVATNLDK